MHVTVMDQPAHPCQTLSHEHTLTPCAYFNPEGVKVCTGSIPEAIIAGDATRSWGRNTAVAYPRGAECDANSFGIGTAVIDTHCDIVEARNLQLGEWGAGTPRRKKKTLSWKRLQWWMLPKWTSSSSGNQLRSWMPSFCTGLYRSLTRSTSAKRDPRPVLISRVSSRNSPPPSPQNLRR